MSARPGEIDPDRDVAYCALCSVEIPLQFDSLDGADLDGGEFGRTYIRITSTRGAACSECDRWHCSADLVDGMCRTCEAIDPRIACTQCGTLTDFDQLAWVAAAFRCRDAAACAETARRQQILTAH